MGQIIEARHIYLQNLIDRVGNMCRKKDWKKDWSNGGCYMHLEVSEFIESLRGKGYTPPKKEAADVIITLFAVLSNYNINATEVFNSLEDILAELEVAK